MDPLGLYKVKKEMHLGGLLADVQVTISLSFCVAVIVVHVFCKQSSSRGTKNVCSLASVREGMFFSLARIKSWQKSSHTGD